MTKKKPRIVHNPKKIVFSRNNSFNSSILNLSMNYKKQAASLKENNRELARQLNIVQHKLKSSETVICEMQKTCNQQALKIIQDNLNKMASQLRPFLDILQQSIHYCAYPDAVNADATILNPDLDLTATPPHQNVVSNEAQSNGPMLTRAASAHRVNGQFDLFPMTPIHEQSSREELEAELPNPGSSGRSRESRFSNVTRRTKSKSRSTSSNSEGTPTNLSSSTGAAENKDPIEGPVESLTSNLSPQMLNGVDDGCANADRLPTFITAADRATPEIYKTFKPLATHNFAVPEGFQGVVLPPRHSDMNYCNDDDDDNLTVKIPVDMDLTMVKEIGGVEITETTKAQLRDVRVVLDPIETVAHSSNDSPHSKIREPKAVSSPATKSNPKSGFGKVLVTKKTNRDKHDVTKTNVKTSSAKTLLSTKIPKLTTKERVAVPESKVSDENISPSSASKDKTELIPAVVEPKDTKRRSILRSSLAPLKEVEHDNSNTRRTSTASARSRKSVCFTESTDSAEPAVTSTKRTKRLTYTVEAESFSSGTDSDYSPPAQKQTVNTQKKKPKPGTENFRFFSNKKVNRPDENKPSRRKKLVGKNVPQTEKVLPSVYDLSYKDITLTNGDRTDEMSKPAGNKSADKCQLKSSETEMKTSSDSEVDCESTVIYNQNQEAVEQQIAIEKTPSTSAKHVGGSRPSIVNGNVETAHPTDKDKTLPSEVNASSKKPPGSSKAKRAKSSGSSSIKEVQRKSTATMRRSPRSERQSSVNESCEESSAEQSGSVVGDAEEPLSRRRNRAVSYKEPSLNKKMRRA